MLVQILVVKLIIIKLSMVKLTKKLNLLVNLTMFNFIILVYPWLVEPCK
jgi:hypothetical protein